MKSQITTTKVPPDSDIYKHLVAAYFFDSYQMPVENRDHSAIEIYLDFIRTTPIWVNRLMTLRNKFVSAFGLKNLGHLDQLALSKTGGDYCVGDKVGIFSIFSLSEQEVILEDSDKHLDVKLSIYKNVNGTFSITTVVHIHNIAGRIYMFFVAPVHKYIVRSMLARG